MKVPALNVIMPMTHVKVQLQDPETNDVYSMFTSAEDSERLINDDEFANAMLRHVKMRYGGNTMEKLNENLKSPFTSTTIIGDNTIETSELSTPSTSKNTADESSTETEELNNSCEQAERFEKFFWKHEQTLQLISSVEAHYEEMQHPNKRKHMWGKVAKDMLSTDANFTAGVCLKKWENLLRTYKNCKDKKSKTGRGPMKFAFFDRMDEFLDTKLKMCGTHTIDVSSVEQSNCSDSLSLNSPVDYVSLPGILQEHDNTNKRKRMNAQTAYFKAKPTLVTLKMSKNTADESASESEEVNNSFEQAERYEKFFWKHDQTLQLISSVEAHYEELKHPTKRKHMWENVANDLLSTDANFTAGLCLKKWENLLRTYKNCKDKKSKTGRGPMKFAFFDRMDEFLDTKPNMCGTHTIDVSLVEQSNCSDSLSLNSPADYVSLPATDILQEHDNTNKRKRMNPQTAYFEAKPTLVTLKQSQNTADESASETEELNNSCEQAERYEKFFWKHDQTLQLISLVKAHYEELSNPSKRKHMWDNVANAMLSTDVNFTVDACMKKWKNLMRTYKNCKEKKLKTGFGPSRFPFFDPMDEFLDTEPNMCGTHSIDVSLVEHSNHFDSLSSNSPTDYVSLPATDILQEHDNTNKRKRMNTQTAYFEAKPTLVTLKMSKNTADESASETEEVNNSCEQTERYQKIFWKNDQTLQLISLVEAHYEELNHPIKRKQMWDNVANAMLSTDANFTVAVCMQKWKGLLRTYKNCKDKKSKTGRGPSRFAFFDCMDEFLDTKPNMCGTQTFDVSLVEQSNYSDSHSSNSPADYVSLPATDILQEHDNTNKRAKMNPRTAYFEAKPTLATLKMSKNTADESASEPEEVNNSCEQAERYQKFFWKYDQTLQLISSVEAHYEELNHPTKRKHMWDNVANAMLNTDANFTAEACMQKWKNLLRTYKNCKDKKSKTGRGPTRFAFFDSMDEFLGTKLNICGTHIDVPLIEQSNCSDSSNTPAGDVSLPAADILQEHDYTNKRRRTNPRTAYFKAKTTLATLKMSEMKRKEKRREMYRKQKLHLEERKIKALEELVALLKEKYTSQSCE